jgi:hypothetical protein
MDQQLTAQILALFRLCGHEISRIQSGKAAGMLFGWMLTAVSNSNSSPRTLSATREDILADGQANPRQKKRLLAVASGGGHWIQLCRLMPAFDGHDTAFLTTISSNIASVNSARFYVIRGASLWEKLGLVRMGLQVFWILLRERPDVVITTGAAIGYFAVRIGKLLGARTIWIDSIANVEKLSVSGQHVARHADLWLTQWPQLAKPEGPKYLGAVL